jgi:hypothetical protein
VVAKKILTTYGDKKYFDFLTSDFRSKRYDLLIAVQPDGTQENFNATVDEAKNIPIVLA